MSYIDFIYQHSYSLAKKIYESIGIRHSILGGVIRFSAA